MKFKLLELLKNCTSFISKEEISERLNLSRQTVFRYIDQLREIGYDIQLIPHLGYKLVSCPDRLLPFEIQDRLNTKVIGKKIYHYDLIGSTMDIAMKLALDRACEGAVVCAEGQIRGRGRLGREWISPKYKGVYFSLILRPEIPLNQAPIITLLTAVGICQAINKMALVSASIKWPNDILVNNKKIGGILTELNAEQNRVNFIIVGIGINVNTPRSLLPPNASSLEFETKEDFSRIELVKEILRDIEYFYLLFKKKGAQPIIEKWRQLSFLTGERVEVACQKKKLTGVVLDIDSDGSLLIREDSGFIKRLTAGDIIRLR